MDYHTTKQKMVSLLFILAFGSSIMHAKLRIDSPEHASHIEHEIKAKLNCDDEIAKEIREILNGIDTSIFAFLDHKHNRDNCRKHADQFNPHLQKLEACKLKAKEKGQTQAEQTLEEIITHLKALIKEVKSAQGKNGKIAAMSLGSSIQPIIKRFISHFPNLELGTDHKIEKAYKKAATLQVYLELLEKRLEVK